MNRRRAVTAALGVAATALVSAACGAGAHGARSDPPGAPTQTTARDPPGSTGSGLSNWLMTRQAVAEVATDPAVRRRFSARPVDELLQPAQSLLPGVPAQPVVSFASASQLRAAIRGHSLPTRTYAVLYDPEVWPFTPREEQLHPVGAAAGAAATARARGLRFIAAPALDLTTAVAPGSRGPRASQFLATGLAGRMAHDADVVELQAQSLERDTGAFRSFVTAAAAQARRANPKVRLLAGLSTNPPGAPVTLAQLRADISATRSVVGGYWLNIPGQGARCPTCNAARPQLAIQLVLHP